MTNEKIMSTICDSICRHPYRVESQAELDILCEDCVVNKLEASDGDLISRADAIEAVFAVSRRVPTMAIRAKDALESLPSASVETEMSLQKWIPCSERLPKAENMYQPPEQRYLCQLEAYGEKKFCVLSRLKGAISPFWDWYGVAVHDSEVTAWMPLPKPYGEREGE